MNLRRALLNAEDGLLVRHIVSPVVLDRLPLGMARDFARMRIEWLSNRVWGESFTLGDDVVRLGHRKGDHVATHPHLYGLSERAAEEILRVAVEGTLLHELGHAVLDSYSPGRGAIIGSVLDVLEAEGPMSTYLGIDVEGDGDVAHEAFAEAFRYWCFDDERLRKQFPVWHDLLDYWTR